MKTISLYSWNVNGIRAIEKKGFLEWIKKTRPDILGVQETKAQPDQIPKNLLALNGYTSYWNSADRKGYSGVGLFTRIVPKKITTTFSSQILSDEGRIIVSDYGNFYLYNVYFPNGGQGEHRLLYKLKFYEEFLTHLKPLIKKDKKIIICGDVNTAHTELDLARPKENQTVTGFLPEERAWIDKLLSAGFIDTFRQFHHTGDHYTYWDYKTRSRERNVGWRIDYFFVTRNLARNVRNAFIDKMIFGSDHCPLGITLTF